MAYPPSLASINSIDMPAFNLKSPASPVMSSSGAVKSDLNKAATVFPSHVRRTFSRHPTDFTGELVRLLDDITTVTHSIAAYVAEGSETVEYGASSTMSGLDPLVATRRLYKSLSHDGYACLILDKNQEAPLAMPPDAPKGAYVVMVSALDHDESSAEQPICGTIFSVYKRRSLPSLPGRLKDMQQNCGDQVAAGYVMYSSATTLYYTLGKSHGVFSFCLHPVATQYFLQPTTALSIPESSVAVYGDRQRIKNDPEVGAALTRFIAENKPKPCKNFDTGSMVGNFNEVSLHGGVAVKFDAHLLCEAAPFALLIEQKGGKAIDATGTRILDLGIDGPDVHKTVTIMAGSATAIDQLKKEMARVRDA